MKELLTALCLLACGTILSAAKPVDRDDTRFFARDSAAATQQRPAAQQQPQRFVSQHMAKPPVARKGLSRKMRAYQAPAQPMSDAPMRAYQTQPAARSNRTDETPTMHPGRNYDNPAANRFGDGSEANKYIWGSGHNRQMP